MPLVTQDQLYALFSTLNTWQDRYREIIKLAKLMPILPEEARSIENQIYGCENHVWLIVEKNSQHQLNFYGDSEGRIVKGLMTILLILANGKTAVEIAEFDFAAVLKRLKIIDELSESRQLGVQNIINKIKHLASMN